VGHDFFHPHSSYFFILPFDASSSEQMKNGKKCRLIIQEAKAHPELWLRGGRKEGNPVEVKSWLDETKTIKLLRL
jgi:hypothetical protein